MLCFVKGILNWYEIFEIANITNHFNNGYPADGSTIDPGWGLV